MWTNASKRVNTVLRCVTTINNITTVISSTFIVKNWYSKDIYEFPTADVLRHDKNVWPIATRVSFTIKLQRSVFHYNIAITRRMPVFSAVFQYANSYVDFSYVRWFRFTLAIIYHPVLATICTMKSSFGGQRKVSDHNRINGIRNTDWTGSRTEAWCSVNPRMFTSRMRIVNKINVQWLGPN